MEDECKEIMEVAEGPSVCVSPEQDGGARHHAADVLEQSTYGIKTWLDRPFDDVLPAARRAAIEAGFGVISELDVRDLFQQRLGERFPHYFILGLCQPKLAYQALEFDRDIGLLLPCNVIVYEQSGGTVVAAVDPIALLALADSGDLREVAIQVKERLQGVIDRTAASVA